MSHFSLMVVTDNGTEDEVRAALQPYHEYESTGVKDEHVVFEDNHDEVMQEWETKREKAFQGPDGKLYDGYEPDIFYREPTLEESNKMGVFAGSGFVGDFSYHSQDWGDGHGYRPKVRFVPEGYVETTRSLAQAYESPEAYAEEWHGYSVVRNGRIGRYTNPNSKWDWWTVGGRWADWLLLKSGRKTSYARKGDVDFSTPKTRAERDAAALYERARVIADGRTFLPWDLCRQKYPNVEEARDFYHAQEVVTDLRTQLNMSPFDSVERFLTTKEEFVRNAGDRSISTFAVLKDGVWAERGEMGWWGVVHDENDDWYKSFAGVLSTIPDDKMITIVDCHI